MSPFQQMQSISQKKRPEPWGREPWNALKYRAENQLWQKVGAGAEVLLCLWEWGSSHEPWWGGAAATQPAQVKVSHNEACQSPRGHLRSMDLKPPLQEMEVERHHGECMRVLPLVVCWTKS